MTPDFNKQNGLVPAIIQDYKTNKVLMLGYMNEEAYIRTKETGFVTFYSRSKQQLWTKGEESGNKLILKDILLDCDKDTILIKAEPLGPACHTGNDTCFDEKNNSSEADFLNYLQELINKRKQEMPEGSYTTQLFQKGINKIAQKVGEEAVEVIIEAKDDNKELLLEESADLLYHLMVLLSSKNLSLQDVVKVLEERH